MELIAHYLLTNLKIKEPLGKGINCRLRTSSLAGNRVVMDYYNMYPLYGSKRLAGLVSSIRFNDKRRS